MTLQWWHTLIKSCIMSFGRYKSFRVTAVWWHEILDWNLKCPCGHAIWQVAWDGLPLQEFTGVHCLKAFTASLYIYIFQMIEITKIISQNYWLVFTNRFPEMTVNRQGATLQQFYSASQLSKLNKLTREPKRNLKLTWDATHSSWISLASLKTKEPLLTNLVVFCCDHSGYVV